MSNSTDDVGLKKLTDYLIQTRRQCELTVDGLNSIVSDLKRENDSLKQTLDTTTRELTLCKLELDQYKSFSSKKALIEERSRNNSLIQAVQVDRDRLSRENVELRHRLDEIRVSLPVVDVHVADVGDNEHKNNHHVNDTNNHHHHHDSHHQLDSNITTATIEHTPSTISSVENPSKSQLVPSVSVLNNLAGSGVNLAANGTWGSFSRYLYRSAPQIRNGDGKNGNPNSESNVNQINLKGVIQL